MLDLDLVHDCVGALKVAQDVASLFGYLFTFLIQQKLHFVL